ncbi:hypothetical protein D3C85_1750560 [compost metagenome]
MKYERFILDIAVNVDPVASGVEMITQLLNRRCAQPHANGKRMPGEPAYIRAAGLRNQRSRIRVRAIHDADVPVCRLPDDDTAGPG